MQVITRSRSEERAPGGFDSLLNHADASSPRTALHADSVLALTPSSGTTGPPKGVLKSDRTLRAGAMGVLRVSGARDGAVFLFWEALHHGAGVAVLIAAVLEQITLVMVERFSASAFWDQVRRNKVTHIHYLGGVLPLLLKQPPTPADREHDVRVAWGGGCPPDIWQTFAGPYLRDILRRLFEMQITRLKEERLGALQRMDPAVDPEGYQLLQRELMELETARRALRSDS